MADRYLKFLNGGGVCGALIHSTNWEKTTLGSPSTWPLSLLTSLNIVLQSRFPMILYWGPQLLCFYNDAFLPSLGKKGRHPNAFGKPAAEVWSDIWETVGPSLQNVYTTGESNWHQNRQISVFRNGKMENAYWTYSSTPVKNDEGEIYGILTACNETTQTVEAQQKLEETNEWLQIALNAGDMGTWDLNTSTYILHSSPLTKKLFGLSETQELDLKVAITNIHPKDRSRVIEAIEKSINNGSNYDITYTVVMPDSTERIIHAKGKMYYSPHGEANRFAGILQDITANVSAHQQQQWLASLVENNKDFMNIAGLDGRVIYLNKAGRLLAGLEPDEDITHLETKAFFTEESYEKAVNEFRPVLERDRRWSGNIVLKNFKTGELIPCFAATVQVKDPQSGNYIAWGSTLRDLRPELEAKRALQESKDRLSLALQSTDMGIFDWHIKEDALIWDERCRQLFGISNNQPITYGSSFLNGLHPDDRPATEEAVSNAMNQNGDGYYTSRYRTVTPEGAFLHWVQASGRCFFNENGEPVRMVGIVHNVTDQVIAQEEIKEKEAHFRLLIDALNQLVWIADVQGNIIYLNKSTYQYTNMAAQMHNVKDWTELLHPTERNEYLQRWQQALATGEEMMQEHRICHLNNEYRWHLTRITPYKDINNNIEFWVSSSTDIQLIKDHEEQKNDFFQMASHELKTPVTSMKAYNQFLYKQFMRSNQGDAAVLLGKMGTQINKLEILINDLLDINKIEGGKMRFNEGIFVFEELVNEVVEEMQRTTDKQIVLQGAAGHRKIKGDRDRIGQVLTNLLSNAIKYSPRADKVLVTTKTNNEDVLCCVTDYGIGIPAEQQKNIFNRFYRVSGQNTDTFPGLGLGLYISAEIIKRQNGKIWLNSQPQEGSDFCFSLPIYAE